MWNDTDVPLAHLITFRCYGTWLHGDARGSVDRLHNQYKAAYAPANENRSRHNKGLLKSKPILLSARQRSSVERAIRETCILRRWNLHAVNVRTNHAHTGRFNRNHKIRTCLERSQSKRNPTDERRWLLGLES
jgi:hypothetical protein